MAKLSHGWERDRIMGFKGKLDFYYWKGIPVVRKWPYTPRSHLTSSTRAQWPKFALVSTSYSAQSAQQIEALLAMSNYTQRTSRDVYIALNYAKVYTFVYAGP